MLLARKRWIALCDSDDGGGLARRSAQTCSGISAGWCLGGALGKLEFSSGEKAVNQKKVRHTLEPLAKSVMQNRYPQITQMLEASSARNSAQLRNQSLNNQCN